MAWMEPDVRKLNPALTAKHALPQGKMAAHNINASIRGTEKKHLDCSTIAQLRTIGRRKETPRGLGVDA
jgi:NADH dehydrogenase FAD-containing subunit